MDMLELSLLGKATTLLDVELVELGFTVLPLLLLLVEEDDIDTIRLELVDDLDAGRDELLDDLDAGRAELLDDLDTGRLELLDDFTVDDVFLMDDDVLTVEVLRDDVLRVEVDLGFVEDDVFEEDVALPSAHLQRSRRRLAEYFGKGEVVLGLMEGQLYLHSGHCGHYILSGVEIAKTPRLGESDADFGATRSLCLPLFEQRHGSLTLRLRRSRSDTFAEFGYLFWCKFQERRPRANTVRRVRYCQGINPG